MTFDELLEAARSVPMTYQDRETQRRSFVYGNVKIENGEITKEIVDEAARSLDRKGAE